MERKKKKERLQINQLVVAYDKVPVIDGLSHRIPDQKITSIIGANGCGKSTLLKAIARLIPYRGGQVILDGKLIHKEHTKQLAKKMAILSQKQPAMEGLTVKELVAYGRYPHQNRLASKTETDEAIIQWAMEKTGINAFGEKDVSSLSGGQLQRVWIAMALAQETDIILLDEPTTYLDMAHQMEVLELLKQLNKDHHRTIIMVLHDINQAARFSDHIIAMKDGDIVAAGSGESIIKPEILKKVYNIDAYIGQDPITKKPMCLSYSTATP